MVGLLQPCETRRLGCGALGLTSLLEHPWFDGFDWPALVAGRMPPPFVPPREPTPDMTAQLLADGLAPCMLEPPPVDAAVQVQLGAHPNPNSSP